MTSSKECLGKLSEMQNAHLNATLIALMTALINEARKRSDLTDSVPDIYRNQGVIKELKALRKQFKPRAEAYKFNESYES